MAAHLAIAPGSWGVEPPGDPTSPPYGEVLDEIKLAGYRNVELGPVGYLPEDPALLADELSARGLRLVSGFAMETFHRRDAIGDWRPVVERTCRVLGAAGAGRLVIIEGLTEARSRTAGRGAAARRLDSTEWTDLVRGVGEAASIAAAAGLESSFHPHAGTAVEFRDEIDRLLEDLDASRIGLCIDTGHLEIASIDPVALIREYGSRINHVHLKDVDPDALAALRASEKSFEEMVAGGVFSPLGAGCVDFPAVVEALAELGYEGTATIEQDRLVGDPRALPDARSSLHYAATAGFSSI